MCVLLLLFLVATPAAPTVIRVDAQGGGDYQTVHEGVVAAAPHDTVLVFPGTYPAFHPGMNYSPYWGRIYITKPLVLISAAGSSQTLIVADEPMSNCVVIEELEPLGSMLIKGFTLSCGGSGGGIVFSSGTLGGEISDCVIQDCSGSSLRLFSFGSYTITNCSFVNSGDDGVQGNDADATLAQCSFVDNYEHVTGVRNVHGCTFVGGDWGIECLPGGSVAGNLVIGCGTGLTLRPGLGGSVSQNTVVACGRGVTSNDAGINMGFTCNLIAHNTTGVHRAQLLGRYTSNNVWGNDTDYFASSPGEDDFPDCDPLFCDYPGGDYTLDAASPCLQPEGECRIGAFGVGCGAAPAEDTTWGCLKSLFR